VQRALIVGSSWWQSRGQWDSGEDAAFEFRRSNEVFWQTDAELTECRDGIHMLFYDSRNVEPFQYVSVPEP